MYRNMLFFTLRFIATGAPSSYSIPASPPSPERPDILRRSSSSNCACDFLGDAGLSVCGAVGVSDMEGRELLLFPLLVAGVSRCVLKYDLPSFDQNIDHDRGRTRGLV